MANHHKDRYELEEAGGDTYPDLATAQLAVLSPLSQHVVQVIQEGIKSGRFVVEEGVVRLAADDALSFDLQLWYNMGKHERDPVPSPGGKE